MNEYRIIWIACPHIEHSAKLLFVEAHTAEDAETLARDFVQRRYGVVSFTIRSVEAIPAALPPGKVKEG